MSSSETDMAPGGGPCAICNEYRWCHQKQDQDHEWCGFFWRITHRKRMKREREAFLNRGGKLAT